MSLFDLLKIDFIAYISPTSYSRKRIEKKTMMNDRLHGGLWIFHIVAIDHDIVQ